MKKFLYIVTLSLFATACGNDSNTGGGTNPDSASMDSSNTAPVNDAISNPNRVPGSTQPGEAMGNGDTASYEGQTNRPADSTRRQ